MPGVHCGPCLQLICNEGLADFTLIFADDNAPAASKSRWLACFYLCIPVGYALGYVLGGLLGGSLGWVCRIKFQILCP